MSSLEQERQNILDRMQARREVYRRMLTTGADLTEPVVQRVVTGDRNHLHQYTEQIKQRPVQSRDTFPRSTVMRVLTQHPVLCTLGVAAVVVIGPKRIVSTAVSGATAVTALTANNPTNTDMAGRLLTMVGAYIQGRTQTQDQR